jgi:hypothetical protein
MPRIEPPVCCHLSPEERIVVDEMKATVKLNDADLVRLGLWHLARHLDIALHGEFVLRKHTPKAKRRIA